MGIAIKLALIWSLSTFINRHYLYYVHITITFTI